MQQQALSITDAELSQIGNQGLAESFDVCEIYQVNDFLANRALAQRVDWAETRDKTLLWSHFVR